MKILFVSDVYSTPLAPKRGVGNARILEAMRAHASIKVVSPVPWYPRTLAQRVPSLKVLADLPPTEPDRGGAEVLHPRRLQIPRSFATQAVLYAASIVKPLRDLAVSWRPDVILTAWAYPDATAVVAVGRLLGLPVVVRVLGSDINDYAHRRFRRPQIALAMQEAKRIIAVSNGLRDELLALDVAPENVAVIPTGVDRTKFFPVDRNEAAAAIGLPHRPLIVVPSRLAPEKGITVLLDALSTLDGVHCALVGDGPEEAALRAQCDRLGLSERVHFVGFQAEARIRLYLSAADLMCLPSFEEGWPDAVMESFACGCPVVASRVGGVPEQIALTECGATVPPRDASSLRAAIRQALDHTWDRKACAERMAEHTLHRTGERYVNVCAEAAA